MHLLFFLKPCFFLLLLLSDCLLSLSATAALQSVYPYFIPRVPPFAPIMTFPLFSWGSRSPLEAFATVYVHMRRTHTTHKALSHLCPSANACLMYSFNFIQTCILSRKTNHKTLTHSQVSQCEYPHTNKLPRRLSPLLLVSTHIHPGARWWLVAPVTWLHRGDTASVTLTAGISQRSTNYCTLGTDGGEEGWRQNGGGE